MSNNLYQESINILKKASSASTEAERNRLYDQANEIFRNPDFVKSYQPSNSSNNGSGLTSGPSCSSYNIGPGQSQTMQAGYNRCMARTDAWVTSMSGPFRSNEW
jgi:hypothetical protein